MNTKDLWKAQEVTPEGYKINPLYVETRSKRFQVLMQPSLYEKVKAVAVSKKRSVNDHIHTILEGCYKWG